MADSSVRITVTAETAQAIRGMEQAAQATKRLADDGQTAAKRLEDFGRQTRGLALGLMAFGAAVGASLGLAVKAAQDEALSIRQLDQALKNIGTSYQLAGKEIEGVTLAIVRQSNFADDDLRRALQRLVEITGDYSASLGSMQVVSDLAAARNLDLESAATLVGRALTGNTEMLGRYGIELDKNATSSEILAQLTERFAGSAAAAQDPFKQLTRNIGELAEKVGAALLPTITTITGAISKTIDVLNALDPRIVQIGAITLVTVAALTTFGGTMLLLSGTLLPAVIKGVQGLSVAFGLLRIGVLASIAPFLAIGAAIVIGAQGLFLMHQTLGLIGKDAMSPIELLEKGFSKVGEVLGDLTSALIPDLGDALRKATQEINDLNEATAKTTTTMDDALMLAQELEREWMSPVYDRINQNWLNYAAAVEEGKKAQEEAAKAEQERFEQENMNLNALIAMHRAAGIGLSARALRPDELLGEIVGGRAFGSEQGSKAVNFLQQLGVTGQREETIRLMEAGIQPILAEQIVLAQLTAQLQKVVTAWAGQLQGGETILGILKDQDVLSVLLALQQIAASRNQVLQIPAFQTGGMIPGPIGSPTLAMVHGGEQVIQAGQSGGLTVIYNQHGPIYGMADFSAQVQRIVRDAARGGGLRGVVK